MNCTCISDLEKKLLEQCAKNGGYKKSIKSVRMLGTAITFGGNEAKIRTCNQFEIELDGQKKKKLISMFHTFCPFCGTKEEKEKP